MIVTRKSPASWAGFRGVNLTTLYTLQTSADPLGYDADVYEGFSAIVPTATLDAMRGMGLDYIRLPVNCVPILTAQAAGNNARVSAYLADIVAAIDSIVAAGLHVIFDIHNPPSNANWSPAAILAGLSAAGEKFVTLTTVEKKIATALLRYPPDRVCLELLNEPPEESTLAGVNAAWSSSLCQELFDAVRSVNQKITIIVSGTEVGNISALVGSGIDATTSLSGLDPSQFDRNTIYSAHFYDPHYLSHCGYQGSNPESGDYAKYCDSIGFPFEINGIVDNAALAAAIATATANINADGSTSGAQKTAYIDGVTGALTNTYVNLGSQWAKRYVTGRLRLAAQWADVHGLDRSQIIFGEFGANMGSRGVTQSGRDNWYRMVRTVLEEQNHRWSPWNWDDATGFGLSADNLTVAETTKSALGLV